MKIDVNKSEYELIKESLKYYKGVLKRSTDGDSYFRESSEYTKRILQSLMERLN